MSRKDSGTALLMTPDYRQFIEDLKARAVNRDLILLYWDIGRAIVEKQQMLGWGESVVDRVSRDLQEAFPGTTGFSPRNLRSVKQFYLAYSDPVIWLQAVAKLPGAQNRAMLRFGDKLSPDLAARENGCILQPN